MLHDSEVYVNLKIGGDHGDTSFKMCYQIANVKNPNKKENTLVFSIFEAKDNSTNLQLCLRRYSSQIKMLQTLKWERFFIRVFLFGDYEFLCAMYGLTGANGKYLTEQITTGNICGEGY